VDFAPTDDGKWKNGKIPILQLLDWDCCCVVTVVRLLRALMDIWKIPIVQLH
jgi:hypothetical protein